MTTIHPITRTKHQLPFDRLSSEDFERLCFWLVEAEGFENVEYLGEGGSEQGRDIVAYRNNRRWVFQCKRVAQFGPKAVEREIEKLDSVPETEKPDELVFIVTRPVTARTRTHARKLWGSKESCHFWAGAELDRRVKQQHDIISEFFAEEGVVRVVSADTLAPVAELGEQLSEVAQHLGRLRADESVVKTHDALATEALSDLQKRRVLVPSDVRAEIQQLANRVQNGDLAHASQSVRRNVLYWTARLHAGSADSLGTAKRYREQLRELDPTAPTEIVDALLLEKEGDGEGALRLLRDIDEPDARSTFLVILGNLKGQRASLDWLGRQEQRYTTDFLTPLGHYNAAVRMAQADRWEETLSYLDQLEVDPDDWPDLVFLKGVVTAALLLPSELRQGALEMNLFYPGVRTIESPEADKCRERALSLFELARNKFLPVHKGRADAAGRWHLWLRLTDPDRETSDLAREEVRQGMEHRESALSLLPVAKSFKISFNREQLWAYLEQCSATGGLGDRELAAQLQLAEMMLAPKDFADFLDKEEPRLERIVAKDMLTVFKIQALVRDGQTTAARKLLGGQGQEFDKEELERITAEIDIKEGKNPLSKLEALYDKTRDLIDLQNLVRYHVRRQDWKPLRPLLTELFKRERTLHNAMSLVESMSRVPDPDYSRMLAFLEENSDLLEREPQLQSAKAVAAFQLGNLEEAKEINRHLISSRNSIEDLHLDIDIALQSGDWERFPSIVEREWSKIDQHEPSTLLRLASLVAQTDATADRAFRLVQLAARNPDDDPHILVQALGLTYQLGKEGQESAAWLSKALACSSNEGPVTAVNLQTLVEEWMPTQQEHRRFIEEQYLQSSMPIHLAASGLNIPLSHALIGIPRSNEITSDGRRRLIIPSFSGARQLLDIQSDWSVAMDATSLMILAHLELLRVTVDSLEKIILAPDTMILLLNEYSRVRFHQPSLVKAAEEVRELIDRGVLCPAKPVLEPSAKLIEEVGLRLAELLAAARDKNGYVVHPLPIHKAGSFRDTEASLGDHRKQIISVSQFEQALFESGYLDGELHVQASRYLSPRDSGGNEIVATSILSGPILLDDLALTYLQGAGLFRSLVASGLDLQILPSLEQEKADLIAYYRHGEELAGTINSLRTILGQGIERGKIKFAPRRTPSSEEEESFRVAPTLLQFAHDTSASDAFCCDDRYVNDKKFLTDLRGRRVPVVCVLDILRFLESRGCITERERRRSHHQLRRSGYALVPVELAELEGHLNSVTWKQDGTFTESAELRTIRQYLARIRSMEFLKIPEEAAFLGGLQSTSIWSIRKLWASSAVSADQATILSRWTWRHVAPSPPEWIKFEVEDASQIAEAYIRHLAMLLMPMPPMAEDRSSAFRRWIDQEVLQPLIPANNAVVEGVATASWNQIEEWSKNLARERHRCSGC